MPAGSGRIALALGAAVLVVFLGGCAAIENFRANALDVTANSLSATAGAGDDTIRMHREALAISEKLFGESSVAAAYRLGNLAGDYRQLGDYATARAMLQRTVAIYERAAPTAYFFPSYLSSYADLLRTVGEYGPARPLLERSLKLREQRFGADDAFIVPQVSDLARFLHDTGDLEAARALHERAARLADRFGLEYLEARCLTELADVLVDLGDQATARRHYERALRLSRSGGPRSWLWKAWWAPQRYLPINVAFYVYSYGPNPADSFHGLGRLLEASGDYEGARARYEQSLATVEGWGASHPRVAFELIALAALHVRRGDDAAAAPYYERALRILHSIHVPEWLWQAAFGLGGIAERQGRLQDALDLYLEAVRTLQSLSEQFGDGPIRTRYLENRGRLAPYDALAGLLLRLDERAPGKGYAEQALAVLEAKKTRVVGQTFATMRVVPGDPETSKDAQRVRGKQEEVFGLEAALRDEQGRAAGEQRPAVIQAVTERLARTKAEYAEQVQEFLRRHPRFKAQFVDQYAIDPRLLTKVAGRLPAGTMIVEYFAAPERLYVFVVTSDGRFAVRSRSVSQGELYRLIATYRSELARAADHRLPWADDGSDAYRREVLPLREVTAELAAHLLGPIEIELALYPKLVIVPNDLLLYLPIHALTRETGGRAPAFLAETHIVSYLTQLELVAPLSAPPAGAAPLLALGNPDGSLPAARDELRSLQTLRPSVVVLEGAEATKAHLLDMAPKFSDFHFATHGILDPARPEHSYLLMAGADDDSQRLQLREIAGLNFLPNGLVSLSACDTALGEQVPGAALMTFAAAFSQAGAESIVASLWSVNDQAARQAMLAFYRGLRDSDRATALREAYLALLRQPLTAHPFYWAPFILIGAR